MRLYRGLKSREYKEFTPELINKLQEGWKKILEIRESGNLKYPKELNQTILELFQYQHLVRQYFTDNKKLAESYAKKENGLILELDAPIRDILSYFIIEFQNYAKRKKSFEIVYIVKEIDLVKNAKNWKLKITTP